MHSVTTTHFSKHNHNHTYILRHCNIVKQILSEHLYIWDHNTFNNSVTYLCLDVLADDKFLPLVPVSGDLRTKKQQVPATYEQVSFMDRDKHKPNNKMLLQKT